MRTLTGVYLMSSDLNFLQLPYSLRKLIDDAFNSNLLEPPLKKRKLEQTIQDHIPFTQIPTALSLLNLPPDEQVLAVFRNAASGWSQMDVNIEGQDEQQGVVSRKDFQAICAALLGSHEGESEGFVVEGTNVPEGGGFLIDDTNISEGGGFLIDDTNISEGGGFLIGNTNIPEGGGFLIDNTNVPEGGGFLVEDTETLSRTRRSTRFRGSHIDGEESDFTPESEGEGYKDPYSESEEETSADEYVEVPSTRRSNRSRKFKTKLPSDSDDSEEDLTSKPLSPQQHKDARLAFALFFPDIPSSDLEKQRIMIKDIDRVAKLLKEKLKAEEVSNYNSKVCSRG